MTVAAIYVRVSTEDQARHGYSLAAQVEACRTRAESLGALETRLFADEGVSGALLARPGLDSMREAVRSRAVDLVVVWDPDRLSRNLSHQLLLTEEIERAKIKLEFVNFEWKATPEGQLFYALRGAIAQYEKEKIRERTGRGRLQKARQGKLPLAFRPYGYAYDPDAAMLASDPAEAPVVGQIFRWFLEEGEGPGTIARRLNGLGVPARRGGQWHRAVVRQILANPVYTGVFFANRFDTAGCSLNRHRPKAERVRAAERPRADWVPVPVPALVEPARWQEAQELLERSRRLWAGKPRAEYLLSGLLECGCCHRPMCGFTGTDWGVRRRKYTCRKAGPAAGGEIRCNQTVPAGELEAAVWVQVVGWLAEPGLLHQALARPKDRSPELERERAAAAAALARAEAGRASILTLLEQGALGAAEAAAALGRVGARTAELQARLHGLEAELTGFARPVPDGFARERHVQDCLERYRQGDLPAAERKRLVRALLTRVVVGGRTVALHARWPAAWPAPPDSPNPPDPQDLQATSKS
jgi:site-specific DNA recombinase